jgi:PAS domain S-box-containing protein
MRPFTPILRSFKIQTRLVVYYISFALITLGAVTYSSYTQAARSIQFTIEDKLGVIAELKINNLDHWMEDQQRNAIFLASLPELRSLSGRLLDDSSPSVDKASAYHDLNQLLTIIVQRTADFQDIQIIDLSGNIVVSMIPELHGLSQADQPFFIEGRSKTFTQPFYQSTMLGGTTLTVATPLFDDMQKRVGVLALHFNMKRVDDIIRENRGMNETVYAYLISSDQELITDDPIALAHGRPSFEIPSELYGTDGIAFYTNHDHVPVIGQYFVLDEQNTALIVEINQESALWPARQLALNIAITGTLISLLLVVVVIFMAQRIMAPLRALSETVARISAGELDALAPVLSDDEVGTLARAFNSMTEKLRQTLAGLHAELRERKLAQDELVQFRKVMDESRDAVFMIDPQTSRYLDFNKSANRQLGYSREELSQLGVIDIAEHVKDRHAWQERLKLMYEDRELIFETVYHRKDGTSFPVEVSARLLDHADHQVILALVRDMTERKLAEAALRESEERFRKVFQSSPVAICITTLEDGCLLDANDAYWQLTGYKPEESLGRTASELRMWDVPQERVDFVRDLKLQKSHFNADDYFHHTDGSLKHVISFYELIHIGQEDCILAMFYDMSAQRQTMQALEQSEARIRALLNAFPDTVVELTLDGTITHMVLPKGMEADMSPEHFVGKHVRTLFPEAVADQTLHSLERVLASDQMSVFEFRSETAGPVRVMEVRLVRNAADTTLMLIRDITRRKWVEEEREKLIRELELKNRESETLRESLASIVGTFEFADIIQRILDQIQRVIPYDTASVWRVEGDRQKLIGGRNLPRELDQDFEFVTDESNSALPILLGKVPYILNNAVQDELADFQQPPHTYVNSWLAIPLQTRGRVIGLIALDGRQKNQFNQHHAQLAVTFASQVALALDHASLFENLQAELEKRRELIVELKNKHAEADTLRESAAIVAETLEKEEAIERILEQLERVIPYDSASVQLLDDNMLEIVSMRGFTVSEITADNSFELNKNEPAYAVLCDDAPYVLFDDVQFSFKAFREPPHDRIHAWMAVPLKVKGKKLGIIALDGYKAGQFTEAHAQLAVTYANQVAMTLENARLFSDLQAELVARQDLITELENKNAELERFAYTVSHDLKSPLFTIRGFLGYLEQDALSGNRERLAGDIQRITDATDKMHRLLNELLELSRIGRLKNPSTDVSFEEIAREAATLVHGQIMEHGIAVDIDAGLPVVHVDRPRLVEVMQNLLDNACKFMGDQKEPRIEVGQQGWQDGRPVFYVRDNGIGIALEHFERVFGLFNKLDPKTDGTGIGLALVKRIIEVHGGRVWLESTSGMGTTFFFTLNQEGRDVHG